MKKLPRLLSLLTALALFLSLAPLSLMEAPAVDMTEEAHIVGYVPGDPSRENDVMMEALNAKLKEEFNATIEFKFFNWGEFFDKYPLLFASGEVFDFAYIASWNDYHSYAAKGAYMDITDLVKDYAPDVYRIADPAVWNATSYRGKVYGIPHDGQDLSTQNGFAYRADLGKKHGIEKLETLDELEAYIKAVKEEDPNIATANRDAVNNNLILRYAQFQKTGWDFDWYGLVYQREDPEAKLLLKYETPEYKELIERMAKWKDMGFWDTSVMTGQDFVNEIDQHPFSQGLSAFFGVGSGDYNSALNFVSDYDKDWEIGYFWTKSPSGHINKNDVLNDGVSIAATCKQPERTLQVLNALLTRADYQWLLAYGVEGKHYVVGEDGFPKLPDGITPDNAPMNFGMHPFSWFFFDTINTMPQRAEDRPVDILNKEMDAVSNAAVLYGFYFDTADLATEMAALNDIWVEYEIPLSWGFINESVEADLANLVAKQKAAGIDKVMAEAQRQIDLFLGK